MKNFVIAIAICVLFVVPTIAAEMTAEQAFQSPGVIDPRTITAGNNKGSIPVRQAAPGDEIVGFLHQQNSHLLASGDHLQVTFQVMADWNRPLLIYGRIFYPGPSGQFDESGRVTHFPVLKDVKLFKGNTIEVFSTQIGADAFSGQYVVDLILYDLDARTLVQQVYTRYYVNWLGPSVKFLRHAFEFRVNQDGWILLKGEILNNLAVKGAIAWPLAFSADRGMLELNATTTGELALQIPACAGSPAVDIILHATVLRESLTFFRPCSAR